MTPQFQPKATVYLRWTVGVVVLLESIHFTVAAAHGQHLTQMGLPNWFWIALGSSEAVAAILFLIQVTRKIGAYALLVIFAIAVVVHILHGELNVGAVVVYAAAVMASMGPGPGKDGAPA